MSSLLSSGRLRAFALCCFCVNDLSTHGSIAYHRQYFMWSSSLMSSACPPSPPPPPRLIPLLLLLFVELSFRFEFDFETMERVKVKQEFKYPLLLDMEPFVEGRAWIGNDNSDESQVM